MKKNHLALMLVILFVTAPFAVAQEDELGVTLDLTYVSKWLTKGVEGYRSQGGLFKTIDIDFYGTGFGLKVTHRNAIEGFVDSQRFDYRPYYKSKLFEGEACQTNYNISMGHEHYTGLAGTKPIPPTNGYLHFPGRSFCRKALRQSTPPIVSTQPTATTAIATWADGSIASAWTTI